MAPQGWGHVLCGSGQARRGLREEEPQAVWPRLLDTRGCRNQVGGRLLHTYTPLHPPPSPAHTRATTLTTLFFFFLNLFIYLIFRRIGSSLLRAGFF